MNTGNNDDNSSNDEYATPRGLSEQVNSPSGGRVPSNAASGRDGGRRRLRSNTDIVGPIEDVGRLIARSRSRNRNRNRRQINPSDDEEGSSPPRENEEEKKQNPISRPSAPPPQNDSSRESSVHPERQVAVNRANANAQNRNRNNNARLSANSGNRAPPAGPNRPPLRHNVPPIQSNLGRPNPFCQPHQNPNSPAQVPPNQAIQSIIPQIQSMSINNQARQPQVQPSAVNQSQFDQLMNVNQVLQQQLLILTQRMDQYQDDVQSNVEATLPAFPGLDPEEIRTLLEFNGQTDESDFYKRRDTHANIQYVEDKVARKELKSYNNVLTDSNQIVEWLQDFDFRCDQWGIHPRLRLKACATGLLGSDLMEQLRIERETGNGINTYAQLKRWLFKTINGRARVVAAERKVHKWRADARDNGDAAAEFRGFMKCISKYKAEMNFAEDWGMDRNEINIIPEEQLFDIFMDRASQHRILRNTFQTRVNGRRSVQKAKLLSKHISYIERDRTTKSRRKDRKSKKSRKTDKTVMALQRSTSNTAADKPFTPRPKGYYGPWCGTHRSKSHSWSQCNLNPANKGRKVQRDSTARSFRFRSKPKRNHIAGQNCEEFGHTSATCWVLHPELRPKSKRKAKIFALQRRMNETELELNEAIGDWNVGSSSSSSEPATTMENSAEEEKQTKRQQEDSTEDDEEDYESSSRSSDHTYSKHPRKQ